MTLVESDAIAIGNEPIRCAASDEVVGWVSLSSYGYSVRQRIAYA
jgi:glycine cleavage system aminomethyltransferase T